MQNRGEENGVKWTIQDCGDIYCVAAYCPRTDKFDAKAYKCEYSPICGLDAFDAAKIDRLLDSIIKTVLEN